MLFNSLEYLLFLPLVFILYWSMKTLRMQNTVLGLASMIFYGWWDVRFLLLMIATCAVNFAAIRGIERYPAHKKVCVAMALTLNFGILGVFKYYNFFAENLQLLLDGLGLHTSLSSLNIILPVGISFYTFQLSGFVVDCYKKAQRNIATRCTALQFITFITFFPQLVAGPIERGSDMLPQLQEKRVFSFTMARDGMRQLLWGLMKKMLLADNCAAMADIVFSDYSSHTVGDLWIGALFFTFQIYGDFSGYSDMAIGSAKLFGIQLSDNFRSPYLARDIRDFWRRWHITLMNWFKDYVYIPLGGNRRGSMRQRINQTVVFLLSGLWHGSNWTFVAWGLYNALWFVIPHRLLTFPIIMVGWVIFRSPDLTSAIGYIKSMFDVCAWQGFTVSRMPLLPIAIFFVAEYFMKERRHPFGWKECGWQKWQSVRLLTYLSLFLATLLLGGSQVQFIYFQF